MEDEIIKEAKGVTGQLLLYKTKVVIKRRGVISFMNHGIKGDKEIPIRNITSIQFKRAGMINGYIQFGITGSIESKKGILAAQSDENTVAFNTWQQGPFNEIKQILDERVNREEAQGSFSEAEEIEKFHKLHKQGIITKEEFETQKKKILGL
ncbi:MAG: SHOCT domain-containing protein [Candidatus Berkelbacteria bacterium]|nr:SHOCT domain-containing protein [Candidatus Berkelbacteria bacterium]